MPRFDGTGPRGAGPMTGRGEGHCAIVLPGPGQAPYGYAGLQGRPVSLVTPAIRWPRAARFGCWPRGGMWLRRGLACGWRRGPRGGRGGRWGRW
jgi:hypothetical protein